ncbi:MAG: hypothetical protein H6654_15940 [Ardenticatenaceae bacterium]|nr:hypothetical protein [Ardenticatenaceae bacterium]
MFRLSVTKTIFGCRIHFIYEFLEHLGKIQFGALALTKPDETGWFNR